MPTPVNTARQCLTNEASITLDDAVAMAGRRGHAQTTSLHYISSLLSVPSSCLREACSRTRNNAYSARVQFKALDLCLGVSMDRLPSCPSSSKVDYPPVSNSLMAAIKRSQANQRRQPENFSFYQQQLQNQSSSSSSSVPVVKVELRNLIISVLDDPVVSRVFGEAGFRSCDIKLAILRPVHQLFRYSRFKGPPLFLCNLTNQSDRSFSFPFLGFSGGEDDCRRIGEVFVNNRGKNPLILGTCAQAAMNNFLEMIQSNRGGGILPVEVYGSTVICIDTEIIRFVRGEYDEELIKSKFEEIASILMNNSLGSGIVVNYGDLKILSSDDSYIDSCRYIKVDSAAAEGDDCIIFVSAKETFEDQSPTIDATMRLQPRSSEKTEKESGDAILTTRLLVPSSRVGCLIGKGGSIITEMRNSTRASIRVLSKENHPKVASVDDEMVQITGDANVAANALLQVLMRLRANAFEMEGSFPAFSPGLSYAPMPASVPDGSRYGNRDNRSRRHGYSSYSGGHDYSDLSPRDSYGGSQVGNGGNYAPYGVYSSGRPSSSGVSSHNPSAYGKSYGY